MYLVIMNLVQIWKLKLKMKYLVHILRLVVILIVSPGSKLPVAVGKGCGSSVSAKIPGILVLVSIRLVAPAPRVLARVCVKPLRTGVCCPNSANEDEAVHNYSRLPITRTSR